MKNISLLTGYDHFLGQTRKPWISINNGANKTKLKEFVPDLDHDHRVIILGERYYVSKRLIRKGDFRASGAKLFTFFPAADPAMLSYAKKVYSKVDTPFLSLDIGGKEGGFCLFEFQALHFGANAIVRSQGHYLHDGMDWRFVERTAAIEETLAHGLDAYLEREG